MKDSWRVLRDDIESEGDIYRKLHAGQVPNIPSCLSAGDVDNGVNHESRTNKAIQHLIPRNNFWKLTPHRHYRTVLGTVGRRLEDFKRTQEVVAAMRAALEGKITIFLAVSRRNLTYIIAHEAAYRVTKINILHRDISPGNILILDPDESGKSSEDGNKSEKVGGLLIDWDLSKVVDPVSEPSTARQYARAVS